MTSFPYDAHTRIVVMSSVADASAPTVSELGAATDVTCQVVPSGLSIPRVTGEIDRTRWGSQQTRAEPTRWSTSVELTGFRPRQPAPGDLFSLCVMGDPVVLVVRYGVPWSAPFEAGQSVDVVVGRWGKRSTAGSAPDATATFTAPILVSEDNDAAVVAA